MTNYIWITTQKEMFHRYPDAPDEVKFLRNEHRHIFHFKVYIEVNHNDRDVEFIMFKRCIERIIDKMDKNLKTKSCEMISNYIYEKICEINVDIYPGRTLKVEVSEDGENGSLYEYSIK